MVIPAADWYAKKPPRNPMGEWLVKNMPRGMNLDITARRKSRREIPFVAGELK